MCAFSYNSILDQRTEGNDKLVPVWYRPAFDQPLKSLEKSVSRNAAMLFSEVWEKQLQSSPNVLVLKGTNMEPYKLILGWINMCIEEGNDVKFPDVSLIKSRLTSRLHPILPGAIRQMAFHHLPFIVYRSATGDLPNQKAQINEDEHQLHVLLDVIAAANFLKIPEGSLQVGLKKVWKCPPSLSSFVADG